MSFPEQKLACESVHIAAQKPLILCHFEEMQCSFYFNDELHIGQIAFL